MTAVLGYGTIGSMVTGLLAAQGRTVTAANRHPDRFPPAGALGSGVTFTTDFAGAVRGASTVILCVSPLACAEVLEAVGPSAAPGALLVSTAGDVPCDLLETLWPGPVVRIMPTLLSSIGRGVTPLVRGSRAGEDGRPRLETLFGGTLALVEVPSDAWDQVTALTSCGPGLAAAWIDLWIRAVGPVRGIPAPLVAAWATETLEATLVHQRQTGEAWDRIVGRVATPGGVTGEGVRVLRERLPGVLSAMHDAMEVRHHDRGTRVRDGFPPCPQEGSR